MAKHLHPMQDRIIVKRDRAEDQSKGGIIFSESSKQPPQRGTVIEVGPGRYTDSGFLIPSRLQVGDSVMFGKYAGAELSIGEDTFFVMREEEVFCSVTDDGIPEPIVHNAGHDLDAIAPIVHAGPIAEAEAALATVQANLDREIEDHEADVNPEPIIEQDGKVIDRRRSFGVGAGS